MSFVHKFAIARKGIALELSPKHSFISGEEQMVEFKKYIERYRLKFYGNGSCGPLENSISGSLALSFFQEVEKHISVREQEHKLALKHAGLLKIKYPISISINDIENCLTKSDCQRYFKKNLSMENQDWIYEKIISNTIPLKVLKLVYKGFSDNPVLDNKSQVSKLTSYIYTKHSDYNPEKGIIRKVLDFIDNKTSKEWKIRLEDVETGIRHFLIERKEGDNGIGPVINLPDGKMVTKLSDIVKYKAVDELYKNIRNKIYITALCNDDKITKRYRL